MLYAKLYQHIYIICQLKQGIKIEIVTQCTIIHKMNYAALHQGIVKRVPLEVLA